MQFTSKKFTLFTLLFMAGYVSAAEFEISIGDSLLKRELLIEAEYSPVIQDAEKVNILPKIREITPVKAVIEYSSLALTSVPASEIVSSTAEHFGTEYLIYNKKGYITFGGGLPLTVRGAAGCEILNTQDNFLRLNFNHFSTNAKVSYLQENISGKAFLNDNLLSLLYKHRFSSALLDFSFDAGYTGFNYYGYMQLGEIPQQRQAFWFFHPALRLASTPR
ncbi:MAG: hypothetical protein LBD45_07935, partial [Bacteroidales bacterium]|nr:hypothetical protein [Bacteroidales bacterium]